MRLLSPQSRILLSTSLLVATFSAAQDKAKQADNGIQNPRSHCTNVVTFENRNLCSMSSSSVPGAATLVPPPHSENRRMQSQPLQPGLGGFWSSDGLLGSDSIKLTRYQNDKP